LNFKAILAFIFMNNYKFLKQEKKEDTVLNTVKVSKEFEPLFLKAQECVGKYFKEKKEDATKGTIEIFGQRYILVRAAAMSVEFFETVRDLYKEAGEEEADNIARSFLFDLAHAVGKTDAKNFHEKMGLKDPIAKLSAGPVHFAYTGWAFVDIFPESKPSPDENYYLIYDHPYSFESDAWLRSGEKSSSPVCIMNAGYSSGWCEESFGIPLVASELTCTAKGDEACRFIMAHPSKIEGYIKEYLAKNPKFSKQATKYEIPGFFKRKLKEEARKREEQALQQSEKKYRDLVENAMIGVYATDLKGDILYVNKAALEIFGFDSVEEMISSGAVVRYKNPKDREVLIRNLKQTRKVKNFNVEALTKTGETRNVLLSAALSGDVLRGMVIDITEQKKMEEAMKEHLIALERFQKLTVGRELKMVELKKQIEQFKKQPRDYSTKNKI
jgi:PAS domain S-box-containing protein